jgi:hypothetical protein
VPHEHGVEVRERVGGLPEGMAAVFTGWSAITRLGTCPPMRSSR